MVIGVCGVCPRVCVPKSKHPSEAVDGSGLNVLHTSGGGADTREVYDDDSQVARYIFGHLTRHRGHLDTK